MARSSRVPARFVVALCTVLSLQAGATLAEAVPITVSVAKGGGSKSTSIGPIESVNFDVSIRLPPPVGVVDLFTNANGETNDPPALSGPIIAFGPPPTGLTLALGPIKASGKSAEATASGKVVGEPILRKDESLAGVKNTATGSVSAQASMQAGAKATADVHDPVTFERIGPGLGLLRLGLTLGGDTVLQTAGLASVSTVLNAVTDISGLEFLYSLAIGLSKDRLDRLLLDVTFLSNPVLGLSDAAIDALISSSLIVDPVSGTISLPSDLEVFSAALQIPADVDLFSVSTDDHWQAAAEPVPEPSTFLLLTSGVITGVGIGIFRRKARGQLAAHDARAQRLRTVPSIGPVTATAFVATLNEVRRFSHAHQVEAYLGLVPRERCGIGSWGARCLSTGDYVTGTGPPDGASAAGGG